MKAVILAAGQGTRLRPFTDNSPKALVPVNGKPLMEHILSSLVGVVEEVILVVGYKGEMVKAHFGDSYKDMKLTYVTQTEQKGTGHALLCAKPHLSGKFIVMNGDDLYSHDDIANLLQYEYAIFAKEVEDTSMFAALRVEGDMVTEIVEKPKEFVSNLANIGVYLFDERIFEYDLPLSPRGEYEIPDYVTYLIKTAQVKAHVIKGCWYPVNDMVQLHVAEAFLKSR